jgi:hypothetical protein
MIKEDISMGEEDMGDWETLRLGEGISNKD